MADYLKHTDWPLTLDGIRGRHQRVEGSTMEPDFEKEAPLLHARRTQYCAADRQPWPCEAAFLLRLLEPRP